MRTRHGHGHGAFAELVIETEYVTALAHAFKGLSVVLAQAAKGKRADTALSELRQAAKDMVEAFDARVSLVKVEPHAFAETAKKQHAEMWDKRVKGLEGALADLE